MISGLYNDTAYSNDVFHNDRSHSRLQGEHSDNLFGSHWETDHITMQSPNPQFYRFADSFSINKASSDKLSVLNNL